MKSSLQSKHEQPKHVVANAWFGMVQRVPFSLLLPPELLPPTVLLPTEEA